MFYTPGIGSLLLLPILTQQDPSWIFYFIKIFFTFAALCQALLSFPP
jgi:hypothetical protein